MRNGLRVGIVGVGNCASSLVQGVAYYQDTPDNSEVPGLMHANLGGYRIGDIDFSCAFDVSAVKVGRPLAEAIAAEPNNTLQFSKAPANDVIVARGPTLDGVGHYLSDVIKESNATPVDVAGALRKSGTDVVVCYLPVGSGQGGAILCRAGAGGGLRLRQLHPHLHRQQCRMGGAVCRRQPAADRRRHQKPGRSHHRPHRVLAGLMQSRGVRLDRTYQLNVGGNADFQNMLERERLVSKKISKTQAVTSQVGRTLPPGDIHIGPSDHIPWLTDRKVAYIRLEGTGFGDAPFSCEVKLEVWDSPNSAGVVIDAVRCAKLAKDRGLGGPLTGPSSYFMKSPPRQYPDHEARELVEAFIAGN